MSNPDDFPIPMLPDLGSGEMFNCGSPNLEPAFTMGPSMNGMTTVTFGQDFQTAIQKEIKDYLRQNILADVIRWKDDSQMITVQVSLEGRIITEKTFLLE